MKPYELIELVFLLSTIAILSILVACVVECCFNYKNWKSTRRLKHKLFFDKDSVKVWRPTYWSRSEVIKIGRVLLCFFSDKFALAFVPFIKGASLGLQSITVIRSVFRDSQFNSGNAFKYQTGTHMTQVFCKTCSKQMLGVWMERLPDKDTGEVLTNKPTQAACLTCLKKIPKKRRALYTIVWTEQYNPFIDGENDELYYAPEPSPRRPPIYRASGMVGGEGPIGPIGADPRYCPDIAVDLGPDVGPPGVDPIIVPTFNWSNMGAPDMEEGSDDR